MVSFMYPVMTGSYCPTSWALMALRTLGSALMGPGPMRSLAGGFI